MLPADQELERRRPVWDALSDFFLDTELDVRGRQWIAQTIVASGYSPREIRDILWDEVYPVLVFNLRRVAGEWAGFNAEWMQQEILSGRHRRTFWMRITGELPNPGPAPARWIREQWSELLPFLPDHFRIER